MAWISFRSSWVLWEDAKLLSESVVIYGNLPSKRFCSNEVMIVARVKELAENLMRQMEWTGHPFILGTECDVLSVAGFDQTIQATVNTFLDGQAAWNSDSKDTVEEDESQCFNIRAR